MIGIIYPIFRSLLTSFIRIIEGKPMIGDSWLESLSIFCIMLVVWYVYSTTIIMQIQYFF